MKASVKNTNYEIGQKVYWSEGIEEKYFRGTIIKNLKIAVVIVDNNGTEETICKRNLGIVI
jgi:hypothetical protein